ncbi:hypothetical protein YC2023_029427 [Brassica napus]
MNTETTDLPLDEALWIPSRCRVRERVINVSSGQTHVVSKQDKKKLLKREDTCMKKSFHISHFVEKRNEAVKVEIPKSSVQIAESIPFSSDKDTSEGFTSAVENRELNNSVLVRDIWVFEKSLFHTGACWRLCGRIEFPSKDKIQPAL